MENAKAITMKLQRLFCASLLCCLALVSGADLLWRVKKKYAPGLRKATFRRVLSALRRVHPSERDWRCKTEGIVVRVIDYRLAGVEAAEPIYCRS